MFHVAILIRNDVSNVIMHTLYSSLVDSSQILVTCSNLLLANSFGHDYNLSSTSELYSHCRCLDSHMAWPCDYCK